mgnify:CR=1 FL=1
MIRRPPRSTLDRSSAASDVYKRQLTGPWELGEPNGTTNNNGEDVNPDFDASVDDNDLSLIHISEPTRPY